MALCTAPCTECNEKMLQDTWLGTVGLSNSIPNVKHCRLCWPHIRHFLQLLLLPDDRVVWTFSQKAGACRQCMYSTTARLPGSATVASYQP